jgi:hypothetical protein
MKKKRVRLKPSEEIYEEIGQDPLKIFLFFDELEVEVPEEANFMLVCYKTTSPKIDMRMYGDQDEYLGDYTNALLKGRDDYEFYSFRKDEEVDGWELFLPPPVVGLGIKTRLRPGVSFL